MGRYKEALHDLEKALELTPNNDWRLYERSLVLRCLNQEAAALADVRRAIEIASAVYQEQPGNWRNTLNLALYHLAIGDTEQAERLYREACSGDAPPYLIREAIEDIDDFLTVVPDHEQAKAMRAMLQKHLEETGP